MNSLNTSAFTIQPLKACKEILLLKTKQELKSEPTLMGSHYPQTTVCNQTANVPASLDSPPTNVTQSRPGQEIPLVLPFLGPQLHQGLASGSGAGVCTYSPWGGVTRPCSPLCPSSPCPFASFFHPTSICSLRMYFYKISVLQSVQHHHAPQQLQNQRTGALLLAGTATAAVIAPVARDHGGPRQRRQSLALPGSSAPNSSVSARDGSGRRVVFPGPPRPSAGQVPSASVGRERGCRTGLAPRGELGSTGSGSASPSSRVLHVRAPL